MFVEKFVRTRRSPCPFLSQTHSPSAASMQSHRSVKKQNQSEKYMHGAGDVRITRCETAWTRRKHTVNARSEMRRTKRDITRPQLARRSTIFSVEAIGTSSLQSVTLRRGTILVHGRSSTFLVCVDLFSLSYLFFCPHFVWSLIRLQIQYNVQSLS